MTKGVSIKFQGYSVTIPRILELVKLSNELKKHSKIVIKPYIKPIYEEEQEIKSENPEDLEKLEKSRQVSIELVEEVLKYCLKNKNPVAEVFIAEGADGEDTTDLFNKLGYNKLAEKYPIGLIDLNTADVEETRSFRFTKFQEIMYPKVLKESFVISLAKLASSDEFGLKGTIPNMLGAFPSSYYEGFFSTTKKKIKKWPLKYSIYDIIQCKMPEFVIMDASEKGSILAGMPLEIDKQAAKLLGQDWKNVPYLRLIEERISQEETLKEKREFEKSLNVPPEGQAGSKVY